MKKSTLKLQLLADFEKSVGFIIIIPYSYFVLRLGGDAMKKILESNMGAFHDIASAINPKDARSIIISISAKHRAQVWVLD